MPSTGFCSPTSSINKSSHPSHSVFLEKPINIDSEESKAFRKYARSMRKGLDRQHSQRICTVRCIWFEANTLLRCMMPLKSWKIVQTVSITTHHS